MISYSYTNLYSIGTINVDDIRLSPRTTNAQWSLFSLKSRTFGLVQTMWADKFWGIWGIFGQNISLHFGTVSLVCVFHYSTSISIKTEHLHPHPKYSFGTWVWICTSNNKGFSLSVSVVRGWPWDANFKGVNIKVSAPPELMHCTVHFHYRIENCHLKLQR